MCRLGEITSCFVLGPRAVSMTKGEAMDGAIGSNGDG